MAGTTQELIFENPGQVKATLAVNITWSPSTFNVKNLRSFGFNLWLLRKDSNKNVEIKSYAPVLLAQDQNVFDIGIMWMPSMDDVDTNVPQAGAHQITWEKTDDNAFADPSRTVFNGFSQAFHVLSPDDQGSLSSSSTTSETSTTSISTSIGATATLLVTINPTSNSNPQSTSLSSSAPSATASGGISQSTAIGLGVGLGILVMSLLVGAVFWIIYHRKQKAKVKALAIAMETPSQMPPPQYIYVKDPNSVPVEMDAARRTVELSTVRRTTELGTGTGTDASPGYR